MGEDEVMLLICASIFALVRWVPFFVHLASARRGSGEPSARMPVYLAPLAGLAALGLVLGKSASFDVRADPVYLAFYMIIGAAWIAAASWLPAIFGISYRDDVAERGNAGAAWAIGGAIVGGSFIYTGANIGDGPGWWVIFYTGGIALGIFAACWLALELVTGVSETVTVDRDTSAGVRLGALLLANGVILGRAAAGNWYGAEQAATQVFRIGVAALALTALAIAVERILRPSPEHASQPIVAGAVPAVVYLGVASGWLTAVGWWI